MSKGGYRPNSGRKKGSKASHTLQAEVLRKYLIEEVIKQKSPLIQALINKGLTGDVSALREIFERSIGKVSDKLILEDGLTSEVATQAINDLTKKLNEIYKRASITCDGRKSGPMGDKA